MARLIVVVKKTYRHSNVFFLQPLIPQFCISGHYYGKRYKHSWEPGSNPVAANRGRTSVDRSCLFDIKYKT